MKAAGLALGLVFMIVNPSGTAADPPAKVVYADLFERRIVREQMDDYVKQYAKLPADKVSFESVTYKGRTYWVGKNTGGQGIVYTDIAVYAPLENGEFERCAIAYTHGWANTDMKLDEKSGRLSFGGIFTINLNSVGSYFSTRTPK